MSDDLRITVDALSRRMDAGEAFLFIDTRNPDAWRTSSIKAPGAVRVPVDDFEKHLSEIPKNRHIVTYCT